MKSRQNIFGIFFFILLLAAAFLLAAGLDQVALRPGVPFSLAFRSSPLSSGETSPLGARALIQIIRGIIALAIVLLPVYIIVHLWTRQGRKRLLIQAILVGMLVVLGSSLPQSQPEGLPGAGEPAPAPAVSNGFGSGPPATYTVQPPPWANYVLIIAIASLAAGGFVLWMRWRARQGSFPPAQEYPNSLDKIMNSAETALSALRAGGDIKNTVLRCYYEMSQVLSDERQLTRDQAMTPLEFEAFLVAEGLPQPPIHNLTRLFEAARYGAKTPGRQEESLAIRSLTEIVEACRRLA